MVALPLGVLALYGVFVAGRSVGEQRVRAEAQQASEVCQQLVDMRLNELSVMYLVAGGDPSETRFFDCQDVKKIASDTFWTPREKSIMLDGFMGRPGA